MLVARLASLATAHAVGQRRSIGPSEIVLFGSVMPVWSLILGVGGVLLARRAAPASAAEAALGRYGRQCVTALAVMIVIGGIVAGEKRPIIAMAGAIGLGFSGVGAIEMIAKGVMAALRLIMDSFVVMATKGAAAWAQRREKE
ncbi:hypothetical protein [Sphingomonas sp. TX0522]|uniref:hypothetical protein n=1 Tax=Sphingomonas sp. TX0522 TaxID=2479205 RepID=UPI0018DF98B8|nr:hypothetical protein [Sphingomonas sp. TX0522]MBI0530077.1 hypothetical protein [Sphingomonas sp. TX0522]